MFRWILLLGTHGAMLAIGFALGIYLLPILTAPDSPDEAMLAETAEAALFTAELSRDLKGSDFLHWGEGTISVTPDKIVHEGALSPGPDYKLYLSPVFVETESQFLAARDGMARVGDVKTFENFLVDLPSSIDPANYNTVIVWCESFGEFITAAQYR